MPWGHIVPKTSVFKYHSLYLFASYFTFYHSIVGLQELSLISREYTVDFSLEVYGMLMRISSGLQVGTSHTSFSNREASNSL